MRNVNSPISGNILIVDDTPSNITILKDVLEARGHKIRPATSGEIALATIQKEKPDLILLDVRLPGMDGYEVCRKLKAQPQTEDIPVIFLSVASELEDKVLGFRAGGVDYVTKPIQVEEVIARVETRLKLHAMEEALRDSERQMRLIADNAPACISYVGMDDLRYRFVNRRHEETAGMSREEIVGKHIREVIGESNYQYALKYIEEVKAGKTASYINEFDLEQGKRWINVNYVPDFDEDGRVRAIVVTSHDITDMKQAAEALRQSEEKYRLIAENVEDVIFTLDMNLTYTYVSPSVRLLRGYEPSEVIGHHIRETLSEESLLNASRLIAAEVQRDGQEGSTPDRATRVELQMKRKDGSTVWTEVKAAFLRDSNGAPTGILGVTRDISERKRAEEVLRLKTHELGERVKELNCLYGISKITEKRDIPLDEALQLIVELLPPSWQHPEVTCARITLDGEEFTTENFVLSHVVASQSSDIVVRGRIAGGVEVGYLEERAESEEGPFLKDERRLLDEIAERLGTIVERVRAEEALNTAYNRLNQIIEFLPDPTFVIDGQDRVTAWNRAMVQLSGVPSDSIIGKGDHEYALPFYNTRRPMVIDLVTNYDEQAASQYDFVRTEEDRLVAQMYFPDFRDRGPTWLWGISAPLHDEDGRVVGAIEAIRDITGLKETENKLRESEEFYRQLVETAGEGIFVVDIRGKLVFVNQRVAEISGYSMDELLTLSAIDLVDPEDRAMVADRIRRRLAGDTTDFSYTFRAVHKDGAIIWLHQNSVGISWNGQPAGLCLISDITEMKEAEEALRESEAKYKSLYREAQATEEVYNSLLNSTLDAIVTYDTEGHVTYVNKGFTNLFGWVNEELKQGVPYTPESEREVTMTNVMRVIRHGEPLKDFETKRFTKAGGLVDVSISASRFNDHEGRPAGMLVILRDISERIRAEKELAEALETAEQLRETAEAANRAKSEFVANMSHEIRTPMNAIIGMTDLALRRDLSAKLRDYLSKIRSSSETLLRIINDVLDFSKIEAGRLDIEHVPFELSNVIRAMSDVVCASEACRNIEFLVFMHRDVPNRLIGDPLRLGQILTNLASNAVKFTPQGEVLVRVERREVTEEKVFLDFSVKDTGIGIPPDKLATLFKAFTQADGSTTRRFGGSGLGLTICQRLVQMMGGAIQVESEPGKGSLFSFQVEFDVQPEGDEKIVPTPADIHGLRVLVVDDNSTSREILLEILKSFSFDAVAVSSGEEAIEELIARAGSHLEEFSPYHLVLLDWKMPGIDGIETARLIDREGRLSGRIPKIIMITAFGTEEVRRQAEEAGLDGFLTKPVQPSLLLDTIMDVFGKAGPRISRAARAKAREAMGTQNIRGARILIAEDNEINQQVAKEILEYAGAVVHIAWNGKEAVEAVNESEFDAVLMDIQMPEMDGYEATSLIRSDDRFTNLPVIAMTAHAMAGDREKSLEAGMNDHVSKPINAAALLDTLGKWLEFAEREPPSDESSREDFDRETLLPDALPGMDVGSAVDRLRGNTTLLKRLLLDFARNYSESGKQLRTAVDRRDFAAARSLAHAVKGAAGNLSAVILHRAAADLEQAAVKGNHEECQQRLPIFERALAQVSESIASLEEQRSAKSPDFSALEASSEQVDLESISRDIKELARLAKENQLRTVKYLASVKESLKAVCSQDDLQLLEEAVENLEFESALLILKRCADTLGFRI